MTKPTLSNLEIIKRAEKMGYSSIIELEFNYEKFLINGIGYELNSNFEKDWGDAKERIDKIDNESMFLYARNVNHSKFGYLKFKIMITNFQNERLEEVAFNGGEGVVCPFKITGFVYCGLLFGEPEIPEGQRFRVKETGQLYHYYKECQERWKEKGYPIFCGEASPCDKHDKWRDKSELEPIFD